MRSGLVGLALVAGCGSSTGPSGDRPSGSYVVTATVNGATASYAFTVVSATDELVTLDWTAGDVRGTFPIRATAPWNETAYRVQWLGNAQGANRILRFTATTCSGTNLGNTAIHWTSCTITRP